jgi:hypothetical protein
MTLPTGGDRIELCLNGEWYGATFTNLARKHFEFWARTDAGGRFCVRFGDEGRKWRWPQCTCIPYIDDDGTEVHDATCATRRAADTQATAQRKQTGGL